MKRYLLVITLVLPFVLGMLLIACGGHDEFHHKPLQQNTGNFYAKDMTDGMTCDSADVLVADCLDACTCCYYGQPENTENCVEYCDSMLLKGFNIDQEPTKLDFTRFKECLVGCVSLCDEREKDMTCYNTCKIYLGL